MNKEEIDNLENYLKNILPKSKSTLSISAFGSVDLEDLMNNIKQLKKVPNYNDLLKENVKLKGKLEEKQKIIDEIFNHDYCFPYECPLEAINNDDIQDIIERICNCDNCQDNHKECWLKYFENEILARGKNENI